MSDEPATMPCTHCDNGTVVERDGRGKVTHHLRCTYCQGTGRVVVEPASEAEPLPTGWVRF